MTYANLDDVKARTRKALTEDDERICTALLEDASALVDAYAPQAKEAAKKLVTVRMVVRAIGDDDTLGVPLGASQGTVTALGYSQTWTMTGGGSVGDLYLTKAEKKLLGMGNQIGSRSPLENEDD